MASKTRIEKLEKLTRPETVNNWIAPIVEIERGKENNPDHLQRLTDIRSQAEAAGWTDRRGVYAVEVIKNGRNQ